MNALELVQRLRDGIRKEIEKIERQKQDDLAYLASHFTGITAGAGAHVYQMARDKIMEVYEKRQQPWYEKERYLFGIELDLIAPVK